MLFSLGPRDGNYFNPKCFWWWYNTWCCTGAVRVWNVARIVLWVLGRLVDLVLTLANETVLPLVRILFVSAVAFFNFMLGLLVGEIRMELSIFFPLFMFVLTWILWLFWPQVGCFLENTFWPFFLGLLEFVGLAVRIIVTLANTLIRLWNAMVPVIGFILYVVVEVLVMVAVFFVEILGEFDVWGLVNSLFEALFELVNLAIEVIIAFVTISPTFLRIFATAVGSMLSTWLEAAPICIDITIWLVRILFPALEGLVDLIRKVTLFVKRHLLSARRLLDALTGNERIDDMSPLDDTSEQDIWRTFGESTRQYWTVESAERASSALNDINHWHLANPAGTHSDYHVLTSEEAADAPPAASILFPRRSTLAFDDTANETVAPPPPRHTPYADGSHEMRLHLKRKHAAAEETTTARPSDHPLEQEMEDYVLECRSRLCGGAGTTIPHPLKRIRSERRRYTGTRAASPVDAGDMLAHRRRYTHIAAVAHVFRKTAHYTVERHWHGGDGEFGRRVGHAFHAVTGHEDMHSLIERTLSTHDHPVDALFSRIPVMSDLAAFRWIKRLHPQHVQDTYHSEWASKRGVLLRTVDGDPTGRAAVHVTVDEVGDAITGRQLFARSVRPDGEFIPSADFAVSADAETGANQDGGSFRSSKPLFSRDARVPALPVFKLLYSQDCVTSHPRNVLCIAEIPAQLGCALQDLIALIPSRFPLRLCGYEQQCADIGFYIIERPPITPDLIIIAEHLSLWISWHWIWNGIMIVLLVVGAVFPIAKRTLRAISTVVPVIGWLIDGFVSLIPTVVTWQDYACIFPFAYGFVLDVILGYLIRLVVMPLVMYAYRSWLSFEATYGAIRAVESARESRLDSLPYSEIYGLRDSTIAKARMPADPWFNPNGYVAVPRAWRPDEQTLLTQMAAIRTSGYGATADTTGVAPFARGEAFRGMMVPPMQMGDEMGASGAGDETAHVDREMMRLYLEQIDRSIAYFGVPARTVTTADVQTFENRFRPLIQTAHCTYSWLSQYVNEHMHQREKRWTRAPAEMLHMRGMFDDEHTAAEQRFSLDISRLAENARFNLFGPRPL